MSIKQDAGPSERHRPMGLAEFVTFCSSSMAVNSLAISLMLAALPQIASAFAMADENRQQLVLTVSFAGFAAGQLFVGPLSDRFGRRTTLLVGLGLYSLAAIACIASPTFGTLLVARLVQGLASAVPRIVVVSAVRDCYVGVRMASIMSLVTMVLFIAPVLAPTMGQVVLVWSNWQVLFGILLLHGVLMFAWAFFRLPETQTVQKRHLIEATSFLSALKMFFRNKQSVLVTLTSGACQGCLFAFLVSSPQVIGSYYGLGTMFTVAFSAIGIVMSLAALSNSRLVAKLGMTRITSVSLAICLAAAFLAFCAAIAGSLPFSAFMATFTVLNSLLVMNSANFTALAMEPHGNIAGMASSLYGGSTTLISAVVASAIGQSYDGTAFPLITGSLACCLAAFVLSSLSVRARRIS